MHNLWRELCRRGGADQRQNAGPEQWPLPEATVRASIPTQGSAVSCPSPRPTPPATDLQFLLHKNPGRVHGLELSFGRAIMFYPETSPERCEFAVTLNVHPVALVRGRASVSADGMLNPYVNDWRRT
jgi:RNA repair, ligase-Pnkp-associating, region of Hen1